MEHITVREFAAKASHYINRMKQGEVFMINYAEIGMLNNLTEKIIPVKTPPIKKEIQNTQKPNDEPEEIISNLCRTCNQKYSTMKIWKGDIICKSCWDSCGGKGSFYELEDA